MQQLKGLCTKDCIAWTYSDTYRCMAYITSSTQLDHMGICCVFRKEPPPSSKHLRKWAILKDLIEQKCDGGALFSFEPISVDLSGCAWHPALTRYVLLVPAEVQCPVPLLQPSCSYLRLNVQNLLLPANYKPWSKPGRSASKIMTQMEFAACYHSRGSGRLMERPSPEPMQWHNFIHLVCTCSLIIERGVQTARAESGFLCSSSKASSAILCKALLRPERLCCATSSSCILLFKTAIWSETASLFAFCLSLYLLWARLLKALVRMRCASSESAQFHGRHWMLSTRKASMRSPKALKE